MAYQEQIEAVMFESTKHVGYVNLAIFTEHLTLDRLNVYDPRNEFNDEWFNWSNQLYIEFLITFIVNE